MYNANKPDAAELPSTGRLLKSTAIAAVIAAGLLVTVVLPAEYGKDPTGIGRLLGLTEMGRIKASLAEETQVEAPTPTETAVTAHAHGAIEADAHSHGDGAAHSHGSATEAGLRPAIIDPAPAAENIVPMQERKIILAPDEAVEIKLAMEEGAVVDYLWFTDGAIANFDLHGDRPGLDYFNYAKGRETRSEGRLIADFTGKHGWFWRNRSGQVLTITLRVKGEFNDVVVYD